MLEVKDIKAYLEEQNLPKIKAVKCGRVLVEKVENEDGCDVYTFVASGLLETIKHANKGDLILTAADRKTGKPVLDSHYHTNQWAVTQEKFDQKYLPIPDEHGCYMPIPDEQTFVQITEDISFVASWGEVQNIESGGFINVTKPDDVYGVAMKEFFDTYEVTRSEAPVTSA